MTYRINDYKQYYLYVVMFLTIIIVSIAASPAWFGSVSGHASVLAVIFLMRKPRLSPTPARSRWVSAFEFLGSALGMGTVLIGLLFVAQYFHPDPVSVDSIPKWVFALVIAHQLGTFWL